MATTLLDILALLPSGRMLRPLSMDELGAYLRKYYFTAHELERERRHILRNELLRDGGLSEMYRIIEAVYTDRRVIEKRKVMAPLANYDNLTKKVIKQLAQVYTRPAIRKVGGSVENQARYQLACGAVGIHATAKRWDRMLNLHRALLVGPRVTEVDGDPESRAASLQVVDPSNARLITHPNDNHRIVAVAIRLQTKTVSDLSIPIELLGLPQYDANLHRPAWVVWSDVERFFLRADWTIIGDSYQTHDLGEMPYAFVSLDDPDENSPWPGRSGDDLIAGHLASWFIALNELKEVKSATKQQIISGNLEATKRDQAADSEIPIELPDDVALNQADMSMDVSMFRESRSGVKEDVGNNYGMNSTIMRNEGAQSAEARELQRMPLREGRLESHEILRPFEKTLNRKMAVVLGSDMEPIAFSPDDFTVDFIDPQTPLSTSEALDLFEKERKLGLTNTVDYVMARNPDMTREQAEEFIRNNVKEEVKRNRLMRPLQIVSGSMGAEQESAEPPGARQGAIGNTDKPNGRPPEDKEATA